MEIHVHTVEILHSLLREGHFEELLFHVDIQKHVQCTCMLIGTWAYGANCWIDA